MFRLGVRALTTIVSAQNGTVAAGVMGSRDKGLRPSKVHQPHESPFREPTDEEYRLARNALLSGAVSNGSTSAAVVSLFNTSSIADVWGLGVIALLSTITTATYYHKFDKLVNELGKKAKEKPQLDEVAIDEKAFIDLLISGFEELDQRIAKLEQEKS